MRQTLVFATTALLCFSCYGQDDQTFYRIPLTELMKIKVSVASKTEQTIEKAPSTVTLFTRQDIKRLGVSTISELLAFVPGMQVTRNDSNNIGHNFQARGRATFTGRSVLLLIDNQRQNDDWSGGANWTNQLLSTLNIKQVEVIRGPGSALYGSNAFAAVINIITDTSLNEASVEIGGFNHRMAHAAVAKKYGDVDTSFFVHYFSDSGDDYHTFEGDTDDPQKGYELSAYAGTQKLQLRARYVYRKGENFYEFGGLANDVNQSTTKNKSVSLNYQAYQSQDLTLSLFGYYSDRYQKSFFQPLDSATMSALYDLGIAQDPSPVDAGPLYKLSESGLNLDGQYRFSEHNSLTFGISHRRPETRMVRVHGTHELADVTSVLVLGQPGQIRYYGYDKVTTEFGDEEIRTNTGLYIQDQAQLSDKLQATLGLRYDHYNDFGSTTNPRGALVYSYDPHNTFKLIYGEAFRAPSLSEISLRNNPVSVQNPDLKPDEVATTEFAWIYRTDNFRIINTLYYNRFDNVIEHTLSEQNPPLTIPINRGVLEVSGLEIETRHQLSERLSLDINYAYSIKIKQDPQAMAKNSGSLALNYSYKRWENNLSVIYKGKVEHRRNSLAGGLERVFLDDYWLVNLNTRYKFQENFVGKFKLTNLFDQDYYHTFSSAETIYNGVPNRGLQWSFALEWQY